jgi:hypothetical protein
MKTFLRGLSETAANMLRWQIPDSLALLAIVSEDTLVRGVCAGAQEFQLAGEPVRISALPVRRAGDCWRVA